LFSITVAGEVGESSKKQYDYHKADFNVIRAALISTVWELDKYAKDSWKELLLEQEEKYVPTMQAKTNRKKPMWHTRL